MKRTKHRAVRATRLNRLPNAVANASGIENALTITHDPTAPHEVAGLEILWRQVVDRCDGLWQLFSNCDLALTPSVAASRLGLFDSRFLDKWLMARSLPPFRRLRDWAYLAILVDGWSLGTALSSFALRRGKDPAVYYRFIRRTARCTWQELTDRGGEWVKYSAIAVWSPYLGNIGSSIASVSPKLLPVHRAADARTRLGSEGA